MKELEATATGTAQAPIAHCYERLLDVERYPAWYPDGAKSVAVLERAPDGTPTRIDAVLAAAAGPLRKRFAMRLSLALTPPERIALKRVADDRGDHEALTIGWRLRALDPGRTEVTIELGARLDVPRFFPIDAVGREVARGFLDAALRML